MSASCQTVRGGLRALLHLGTHLLTEPKEFAAVSVGKTPQVVAAAGRCTRRTARDSRLLRHGPCDPASGLIRLSGTSCTSG